ncbi:major capsid protein [Calothrix sp. FACHB-1219]|uniref:major capsid protein n=1 Tax=unclassified Calothrix TaxID=2619626 RepID=UPI0016884095|nr:MULTISPECIES: major capsid protein [unclassified Calothrix]MBD2201557.1 major capsid protein [Calothrix sp. FACHB-168]MBD2217243.1 major capsid protein [Calothrix sp. FACHB-1219]
MNPILATPNFGPYVSEQITVANHSLPGEPTFTELAKSIVPLVGNTPLTELFPEENILERHVVIEQNFQGIDTIFPMVEMGKPDVILSDNEGTMTRRVVQPLYIRRSTFISYGEINSRVRPGTLNERWSPAEQIQTKMTRMVNQHNQTWNIYRAMMLLGGINYTDPRTQVGAAVSSRIPAHNMWAYNVTSGFRGRAEHSLFRTLVDANVADPAASGAGVPWTEPDAAIIDCVTRFSNWFRDTNKVKLTAMYMGPELRDIISMNNEIKIAMGGWIPRFGVTAGQNTTAAGVGLLVPNGGVPMRNGSITLDGEGKLATIAGIPIRIVDTIYKDPTDGLVKRIWPKNKIVFVAEQDSQGASEAPGRTQYCVSEESGGAPGLWTRVQTETQIPAAPGMYVQMGNAGMPYLKYPDRVAHMTVCTVDQIEQRLGVLGDLFHLLF